MKKFVPGNWLFALLLMLLSAVLYGPFLHNPLVFDDINFSASNLGFSPLQIRWLPYATMAWTVSAVADNLLWLRVEALLLHAAVGMTLFFLLQSLYQKIPAVEHSEKEMRLLAFFSACLFVVHPVAVYGAGYLIQRTIVMATLFSLLALLMYVRGLFGKSVWLWLSVLFYAFAVLSKEHAIMLPGVMLALTVLLTDSLPGLFRRLRWIYLACLLIALFTVFQKLGILGHVYEPNAQEMLERVETEYAYLFSVLTQSALFFKYMWLWLFPNPAWMSIDMREPFATTFLSLFGLSSLAFICYGMAAIWLLFRRGAMGVLGFALLFPWLLFFTEFSTIRIQEPFVLYRSYLWIVGLFVALPLLIGRLKTNIAAPTMLFVMMVFAMCAANRLTVFSDPLSLWHDAAKLVNQKNDLFGVWRIYLNRAKYLEPQQALQDYRLAMTLAPQTEYKLIYQGIGAAYLRDGNYPAAVSSFGKALELGGGYEHALYGRGIAYMMMGDSDSARTDFTVICQAGRREACDKLEMLRGR